MNPLLQESEAGRMQIQRTQARAAQHAAEVPAQAPTKRRGGFHDGDDDDHAAKSSLSVPPAKLGNAS